MTEIVKIIIENIPKFLIIRCFGEIAYNEARIGEVSSESLLS